MYEQAVCALIHGIILPFPICLTCALTALVLEVVRNPVITVW